MKLTQTAYIDCILDRFGMAECKPSPTPSVTASVKMTDKADETDVTFPFREAVGRVMYAMTCKRPDIAFAVGTVARHLDRPTAALDSAVKRILRYLKGTRTVGITIGGSTVTLCANADADYACGINDRRLTTGFKCFLKIDF